VREGRLRTTETAVSLETDSPTPWEGIQSLRTHRWCFLRGWDTDNPWAFVPGGNTKRPGFFRLALCPLVR